MKALSTVYTQTINCGSPGNILLVRFLMLRKMLMLMLRKFEKALIFNYDNNKLAMYTNIYENITNKTKSIFSCTTSVNLVRAGQSVQDSMH